ncbi:MAG TPA: PHB depolymerase family esterase [Polyangiaceae bacterium]|nr:PHB depolymerase family esterase [Polyangiaceae bacterium]
MYRTIFTLGFAATLGIACGPAPHGGGTGGAAGSAGTGGGPACGTGVTPGERTASVSIGGVTRTYLLHVPPSYTGRTPVPLVLDFHALGLTGATQRNLDSYASVSDGEGFIVAYPDGIDNAWNIGPCCTFSRSVDDLGFARALVAKLKSEACIDPKRVYAAGYSMGGGMSYFLACNAADTFAAIAPAAFDLIEEMPCTPSRAISVFSFRGTADPIVPYAGGASRPPNGLDTTIHFLGAQGTFDRFATLDQCTGSSMTSAGCQTHSQCRDGVEVKLCTSQAGGHSPADAATAWSLLSRHSLP